MKKRTKYFLCGIAFVMLFSFIGGMFTYGHTCIEKESQTAIVLDVSSKSVGCSWPNIFGGIEYNYTVSVNGKTEHVKRINNSNTGYYTFDVDDEITIVRSKTKNPLTNEWGKWSNWHLRPEVGYW